MPEDPAVPILHPLALNSLRHLVRTVAAGGGVPARNMPKLIASTAFSALSAPLRWGERVFVGPALARHEIERPPIFILGHWRTGTTLLHNLLALNPSLGFVSTLQTIAPTSSIFSAPLLRPLLAASLPKQRMMDNMPLGIDLPQEEEVAMSNSSVHSYYLWWYFPKQSRSLFARYVMMENLTPEELSAWTHAYLAILRKASYLCSGSQLVLKNPVNTGRIPSLLRLFPEARFVYIQRNPFEVFSSTVNLYEKTLRVLSLQGSTRADCVSWALEVYPKLIRRYRRDRTLIPRENLIEVEYADLAASPVAVLERIHGQLGVACWPETKAAIERQLASTPRYEKNRFVLSDEDRDSVQRLWIETLEGDENE